MVGNSQFILKNRYLLILLLCFHSAKKYSKLEMGFINSQQQPTFNIVGGSENPIQTPPPPQQYYQTQQQETMSNSNNGIGNGGNWINGNQQYVSYPPQQNY